VSVLLVLLPPTVDSARRLRPLLIRFAAWDPGA